MQKALLKCPFCDNETASYNYYTNKDNETYSTYVQCQTCGCRTKAIARAVTLDAESEVGTLWNTRGGVAPND